MNRFILLILIALTIPIMRVGAQNPEATDDSFEQFVRFLPLNRIIRNLHIPRSNEEGQHVATMTSSAVTRIDEENFVLQNLVIHLFGDTDDDKTVIETATANYNVRQNIISSEVLTTISRGSMLHVQGEGMVFDTKRHIGRLLRDVRCRMVLKR